ncbi:MAG: NAD-dependent malic enzyme [candidate division KSB1 bacterium]|nr:NAD-dependent malic enzyme [candidate division KSB1 bacterium]MDZ7295234.1 NAD-dependent malic enzyme [candidate division KSB1 bacterium]MDZ7384959.1 NAD-dependent malic enzyme [candidate division KSB1 bacterium]MDZ7391882.1 NAD-dependent malic enzyme [candidate division KSB1 bacterium]MDZ7413254.1 NAD-dependent malic enzyme [candidate division KSB1 bacterium]
MLRYVRQRDPFTGEEYVAVPFKGHRLVEHPMYNKGTAFTNEEREALDLVGLLPELVATLELQCTRAYESFSAKPTNLEKYIYLISLQDRNETLFYRLLLDHLEEMLPIVYTPTVGEACLHFSHIFRRPRGLYVSANNVHKIDKVLANVPFANVSLIVVTDGERILGLGDQGAGGMGIPIGKSSLYVAAAGLHPAFCLPVLIDVGTNNEDALRDPLYIGLRQKRLTGEKYDYVIEQFVMGVRRTFPNALVQWEDFGKHNAFRLLERYRERICSFDDDIQGTGAVTVAALLAAMRIKNERLSDQRFVIMGQGQAGIGIARQIYTGLLEEGLSEAEARARIFGLDKDGLLVEGMEVSEEQRPWVKPRAAIANWELTDPNRIGLLDTVRNAKATVLIGVTGQAGVFDEAVLRQMAANCPVPVIMPLSNPTTKSECTAEFAFKMTEGRCLCATGSPFPPVQVNGGKRVVSQCNNLYVFPGMGLGALVSGTPKVTDQMFMAASRALADMLTPEQLRAGQMLPSIADIRQVSALVAWAVAKVARDSGLGMRTDDDHMLRIITAAMWEPKYLPYRYVRPEPVL